MILISYTYMHCSGKSSYECIICEMFHYRIQPLEERQILQLRHCLSICSTMTVWSTTCSALSTTRASPVPSAMSLPTHLTRTSVCRSLCLVEGVSQSISPWQGDTTMQLRCCCSVSLSRSTLQYTTSSVSWQ